MASVSVDLSLTLAHRENAAMHDLERRIEALDPALISPIVAQTTDWDRRALLALHSARGESAGRVHLPGNRILLGRIAPGGHPRSEMLTSAFNRS
jgi:hypothetical protein